MIKENICAFYRQPNQLNDIIRKLHIVIDFVVSSGCNKDTKIVDYALNTLKMTTIDDLSTNKIGVKLKRFSPDLASFLNN